MELDQVVTDIADALVAIDSSGVPFRAFKPGVGPYGEPQPLRLVAAQLNANEPYGGAVKTKRTPDLLIPGHWALEFKLARPCGDNGLPAENWSVNLLHPYAGNTSAIGDCLKLRGWPGLERKAAVVIGYEHNPPLVRLAPLFSAFEIVATSVIGIKLGPRVHADRSGLTHPVHQQLQVAAWEGGDLGRLPEP